MNQLIRISAFFIMVICLPTSNYAIGSKSKIESYKQEFNNLKKKTNAKYSVDSFEARIGRKAKLSEKVLLKLIRTEKKHQYKMLENSINNFNSDDCDLLILENGDEIEVKVLEVTPREIVYRKCNYPEGPIYTKSRTEVFMVKYSNGDKDMLNIEADPISNSTSSIPNPEDDTAAIGAFLIGILCGFLLSLLGLLFCLLFKKGKPRKAFFGGWAVGALILIMLIISANA